MKMIIALTALLFAASSFPQDTNGLIANPTTSSDISFLSMGEPRSQTEIYSSGEILMDSRDAKGDVVFKVYRDGHAVYTDKTKLDQQTKEFWKEFAEGFRGQFPQCESK